MLYMNKLYARTLINVSDDVSRVNALYDQEDAYEQKCMRLEIYANRNTCSRNSCEQNACDQKCRE